MSAKVIEIMKAKMSLEERQKFVKNCLQNNPNWERDIDGKELLRVFCVPSFCFYWLNSKEGYKYWREIFKRFTDEEDNQIIKTKS